MARESWSLGTTTLAVFSSPSTITSTTFAGERAFSIKIAGFSSQFTISIFSPLSSFTTAFTRLPFIPTQAPTASTSGLLEYTAILVLEPASRAIFFISTVPSATSATSFSKSLLTSSGWVRLTIIFGPRGVFFTSRINTLILSKGRSLSPSTCSFSDRIPSAFPRFMLILPLLILCTIPVTTS